MLRRDEARRRAAVVVMNPTSGGGKVARFQLVDRAERLGARVLVAGSTWDPAALARAAVAEGAQVLGVAGGDGTVSSVAAVAAEADRPLVVVPAGTHNHFARDLGLDVQHPAAALDALRHGEEARVDLGRVNGRPFVNNVSLGAYADALLDPRYRQAKALALATAAAPYLEGCRWVDATVDTPGRAVDHPQVVLVSNNPYHVATPRHLGRRFGLDRGVLGGIVLERSAAMVPPPLTDLLRDTAREGSTARDGVLTWSAPQISVRGETATLPAGVDGESVTLSLPLTCEIRPGALRVLLPG